MIGSVAFTTPYAFSIGLTGGVYTDPQIAAMADSFAGEGLEDMADLLGHLRSGRGSHPKDFQGAIESVARRDEAKLRTILPRPGLLSDLDLPMIAAALRPVQPQTFVNGGAAQNHSRAKRALMISGNGETGVTKPDSPYKEFFNSLVDQFFFPLDVELSFVDFFPDRILDQLEQIVPVLHRDVSDLHQTGEDIEHLLIDADIKDLQWNHTKEGGSFAVLHRTPKVPGAQKRGALVLAVLPKGHRAPIHIHRAGDSVLPGEITLGIHGLLKYRNYANPDRPNAAILTAPSGYIRVSPKGSKDVYEVQENLWVGIYWQPEFAETVRGPFDIPTEEEYLAKCRGQLNALPEIQDWKTSPPSEGLASKVEEFEEKFAEKTTLELTDIFDSNYTFVTKARTSIDKWPTEGAKQRTRKKINERLARLTAIAKILEARGAL